MAETSRAQSRATQPAIKDGAAPEELRDAVRWYAGMVLARRFEDEAERAFRRGKIGGYLHVYTGQEAVAAGWLAELRSDDIFFTAYRDHAHALLRGSSPDAVMAELFGKATGVAKGKGGSMHLADIRLKFWGGHAIVGAHLPLAAGIALADQYRGSEAVTLCFFGDGASNIGYFHEAVNLATVWKLPIVFICENNKYGMGTSIERASAVSEMRQKATGYGLPNDRVDGMELLTVRAADRKSVV